MTFNAHRRLMAFGALRQLGVQTEGSAPHEYEESVAPWNQRVALKPMRAASAQSRQQH